MGASTALVGVRVEVVEFAGAWLPLPPDQRTRLSANGQWCRLGTEACGRRARLGPAGARIILRVGPLDLKGFERGCCRIAWRCTDWVSLVRAYLGYELGFAINLVLAALEVPPLRLDARSDPPPRLGWNTWIPGPAGGFTTRADAADAVFEAEVIEAQHVNWRSEGEGGMTGWGGGYAQADIYPT